MPATGTNSHDAVTYDRSGGMLPPEPDLPISVLALGFGISGRHTSGSR